MEFKSAVLYSDRLAYYDVASVDGKTFTATLIKYKDHHNQPPRYVQLYKEGMRWQGDADEELVRFLGFDIDMKLKGQRMKH